MSDPSRGRRDRPRRWARWAWLALGLASLALTSAVATAPAQGAPREGRWEAEGDGVRIDFVVTRADGRLIAAHPVAFCGSYGEPGGLEDFRPANLLGAGNSFEADYAAIRPGGRFRELGLPQLEGRLHGTRGRVTWKTEFPLDAPPELGGASCQPSAYRRLEAHYAGPVRIKDGYWKLQGTRGSKGWLETYGGGALMRLGGTYMGPPSPTYPEVGPCRVSAGGTAAGFAAVAVPAPVSAGTFAGGVAVDTFGIIDAISFAGQFTRPDWAYGTFAGFFSYLGEYNCVSAGYWIARHREGVKYVDVPEGRGPRPPHDPPEPPSEHWPGAPPIGPNDFRCEQGDEASNPAPTEICKVYVRDPGETINLLWGNKRYGFRHIRKRHGFSRKTDVLIGQTITATPDPQPDGTINYEREFTADGSSCVVRVVVSPDVGIHTAFVLGYPDGRFSRCPWPPGTRLPTPSQPADYVALGDSYSSGEGVPPFDPDTTTGANRCHRSTRAYSRAFAPPGYTLNRSFFACSGAVTDNVGRIGADGELTGTVQTGEPSIQLLRLSGGQWQASDLITLTIGGNDAQFADVLKQCVVHACQRGKRAEAIKQRIATEVPPLLSSTYAAIRGQAPNATTLVLGYPQLFPDHPRARCPIGKRVVSRSKQVFLRERGEQLNQVIRTQAAAAGFHYVGAEQAFAGHEPCGPKDEWLHALVLPLRGGQTVFSFHPNADGQRGYAQRLENYIACVYQAGFPFRPTGIPAPVSPTQPAPAGC
jgi:lysophospholipase L1-like esterase